MGFRFSPCDPCCSPCDNCFQTLLTEEEISWSDISWRYRGLLNGAYEAIHMSLREYATGSNGGFCLSAVRPSFQNLTLPYLGSYTYRAQSYNSQNCKVYIWGASTNVYGVRNFRYRDSNGVINQCPCQYDIPYQLNSVVAIFENQIAPKLDGGSQTYYSFHPCSWICPPECNQFDLSELAFADVDGVSPHLGRYIIIGDATVGGTSDGSRINPICSAGCPDNFYNVTTISIQPQNIVFRCEAPCGGTPFTSLIKDSFVEYPFPPPSPRPWSPPSNGNSMICGASFGSSAELARRFGGTVRFDQYGTLDRATVTVQNRGNFVYPVSTSFCEFRFGVGGPGGFFDDYVRSTFSGEWVRLINGVEG